MLFRTKYLVSVFIAAICVMFFSCEKDQPECKGNCVSIRISGKVYDKTTGAGFKNIPVEVRWVSSRIGSIRYKVVEGNTNADGSFNFTKTVDSLFFKDYYLSVRTPIDTNYISIPVGGGFDFLEERFYSLDINAINQIKFEYYPKAFLKLALRRVQNDTLNHFNFGCFFDSKAGFGYNTIIGQQNARDTTFMIKTAADVFTKVTLRKVLSNGQVISTTDSIVCTTNGANTLNINF
jgi:hypothetical protein